MAAELQPSGLMMLAPRPNGVPYLSDDLRLLQSLSRTLGVVVENVRFREGEQKLRWLAGRAELKALRAQINPHFLFNALNAIAGLIQDHPTLADETVEHLAHVFRYTLSKSETEWVRLEEELEFVAAYLRVEKARFGARLCIHYDLDPSAADVSVPAISIQPLIENAIKHGISVIDAGGTIAIRTHLGDALIIEITNSGPGFPAGFNAAESSGHGLRNIIERLSGYYGESAQLSWSNIDSGARVLMRIPVTSLGHAGTRQAVS
jgi:LytS/YehU family sensor histidine kinase